MIVSESVYGKNKKCAESELFRSEPHNDPSITKSMCKQQCNDNAQCNFYAYWSQGDSMAAENGQGDCRGWVTCPSLGNLLPGYNNEVFSVQRSSAGELEKSSHSFNTKYYNQNIIKVEPMSV